MFVLLAGRGGGAMGGCNLFASYLLKERAFFHLASTTVFLSSRGIHCTKNF